MDDVMSYNIGTPTPTTEKIKKVKSSVCKLEKENALSLLQKEEEGFSGLFYFDYAKMKFVSLE